MPTDSTSAFNDKRNVWKALDYLGLLADHAKTSNKRQNKRPTMPMPTSGCLNPYVRDHRANCEKLVFRWPSQHRPHEKSDLSRIHDQFPPITGRSPLDIAKLSHNMEIICKKKKIKALNEIKNATQLARLSNGRGHLIISSAPPQ
jgi:hypothetical protein